MFVKKFVCCIIRDEGYLNICLKIVGHVDLLVKGEVSHVKY